MASEPVSPVDARILVLSVALEAPLALARVLGLNLDDVQALVSVGYFRQFQRRGLSLRNMTKRLGKSLRTVATLSKRASEHGPPLRGSQRLGWRRLVVRALTQEGPLSIGELREHAPEASAEDLQDELEQLLHEGIIERNGDDYVLSAGLVSLVRDDLDHRLESLDHFLTAVTHVVYRRFFLTGTDEGEAFARVLTFSASRDQLGDLRQRMYESLREEVLRLDREAEADPDAIEASTLLRFVETPQDRAFQPRG
jgi:hypothetical protein